MILHPYSFLLTRPGGHGGDEETQRLLTSIAELKVRSRQNCEADPRTYLDNLRSVSLLPPDLALPLEEIPNFLDCFMTNSQGDAVWWQGAVRYTPSLRGEQRADL